MNFVFIISISHLYFAPIRISAQSFLDEPGKISNHLKTNLNTKQHAKYITLDNYTTISDSVLLFSPLKPTTTTAHTSNNSRMVLKKKKRTILLRRNVSAASRARPTSVGRRCINPKTLDHLATSSGFKLKILI